MIPDSVDKGEEHVLNSTYHLLSDPELYWHLYKDTEDIQCSGSYQYLCNKFTQHNNQKEENGSEDEDPSLHHLHSLLEQMEELETSVLALESQTSILAFEMHQENNIDELVSINNLMNELEAAVEHLEEQVLEIYNDTFSGNHEDKNDVREEILAFMILICENQSLPSLPPALSVACHSSYLESFLCLCLVTAMNLLLVDSSSLVRPPESKV